MADLLDSLIPPNSQTLHANSSQDSFHSVEERGGALLPPNPNTKPLAEHIDDQPRSQPSAAPNLADASAHNGIQVYDVDAYLADPANAALLEPSAINSKKTMAKEVKSKKEDQPLQPIQLGVQTTHYVSQLYQACQVKGLTPTFEIEGEADKAIFRGVLKIRDATIALDEQYRSKREVRERLAEKGVEVVKEMEARKREGSPTGVEGEARKEPNWVGMLQGTRTLLHVRLVKRIDYVYKFDRQLMYLPIPEYHNQKFGPAQSPIYTFYALVQSYACTVVLPSYPDKTFGSPTQTFLGKKLARRSAAAAAVQFLISEGNLNPDGSTTARKKVKLGGGRSVKFQAEGNSLEVPKGSTYAQNVNDIAPMLGLNTPVYHLKPESMDAPNILSGYINFPNSPDLPSRVGEVRNLFGKKAAKEEAAKGAWEALLDLAEKRGVKLGKEVEE